MGYDFYRIVNEMSNMLAGCFHKMTYCDFSIVSSGQIVINCISPFYSYQRLGKGLECCRKTGRQNVKTINEICLSGSLHCERLGSVSLRANKELHEPEKKTEYLKILIYLSNSHQETMLDNKTICSCLFCQDDEIKGL